MALWAERLDWASRGGPICDPCIFGCLKCIMCEKGKTVKKTILCLTWFHSTPIIVSTLEELVTWRALMGPSTSSKGTLQGRVLNMKHSLLDSKVDDRDQISLGFMGAF